MTSMTTPRTEPVAAYLRHLGLPDPGAPSVEALVALHRAHLDALPYENLATVLGDPPPTEPAATLAHIAGVGRAGYCFHQNGAAEVVLRELGYAVSRRAASVWTAPGAPHRELNHLALVVDGLPTDANPGGRWWFDVGLGDGPRDPLPLVDGTHEQGGATYALSDVREDGWSFRHDAAGTFTGVEVHDGAIDRAAVDEAHARLTTAPGGQFTRLVVAQRRGPAGTTTLRGCLLDGTTELATYAAWRGALVEAVRVPLTGLDADALRALHARQWAAHERWTAAGRP